MRKGCMSYRGPHFELTFPTLFLCAPQITIAERMFFRAIVPRAPSLIAEAFVWSLII
jgi:hypothetical protein